MNARRYPPILTSARWILGIGILAWLFSRTSVDELWEVMILGFANWEWWCLGIAFTGLGLWVAALRWHILVRAQGVDISLLRMARIFLIGQCFNSFLLGACGGDVARGYYMLRESKTKRTEAASTVLVDRGIGLLVIIAYCCVITLFRITWFMTSKRTGLAAAVMLALMTLAVATLVVLFRKHLFEQRTWLKRLENTSRFGSIVRRVYNAFYVYRDQPRVLGWAAALSFANMVFLTLACGVLGHSLRMDVSWLDYFTLFPIITVLSAIPVTPGALGVREGLFSELFAVTGVYAGKAISLSLLVYGAGLIWSIIGGLLFIGYSSRYGLSLNEEWQKLKKQSHPASLHHASPNTDKTP
jgi:glycosyltransferase 2 family protein